MRRGNVPPPTPAHCEKSCLVELFEPRLAHPPRRERPHLLFMLLVQPTLDVEPERFHLGGEGGGGWVGGGSTKSVDGVHTGRGRWER